MAKLKKKIYLLWGLPASGKTYWANSYEGKACILDCDTILTTSVDVHKFTTIITHLVWNRHDYDTFIIDGLFTQNRHVDVLFALIEYDRYLGQMFDIDFILVVWNENRPACLINDKGRRPKHSETTIQYLPFEEPSKELIEQWNIKIIQMEVFVKNTTPSWQDWAEKYGFKGQTMTSYSWSLGGTAGSCWDEPGDEKRIVSAEPPPITFEEFDKLLTEVCPNITFLQYRLIYGKCVTTETSGEGDYYGGYTENACYVCDLEKLYYELLGAGLIENLET